MIVEFGFLAADMAEELLSKLCKATKLELDAPTREKIFRQSVIEDATIYEDRRSLIFAVAGKVDSLFATESRRRYRARARRGVTYFVRAKSGDGPIKIGKATDPRKRLSNLQTASFEELEIVGIISGDHFEEYLHRVFWRERIRGEWYRPTPRLERFVRRVSRWCSKPAEKKVLENA